MGKSLKSKIENILARYGLSFAPTEKQYGIFMEEAVDAILEAVREDEQELIDYFESGLLKRLKEENEK